jgi:hypothetical protein
MRSLLLTSILVATVIIPMGASRDRDARRGLRRTVVYLAIFNAIYALACATVFHRLP